MRKAYARAGFRPAEVICFRGTGRVNEPAEDGAWSQSHFECVHVHTTFDAAMECGRRVAASFDRFGKLPKYARLIQ